jgi:hypothetical protein
MAFVCNANHPMKLFQKTYVRISSLQNFFSPSQAKRLGDKTKIITTKRFTDFDKYTLGKLAYGVPHLGTCIFLFFNNKSELGTGINPGMALTPIPSSIYDETRFESTTF